MREKVPGRSLPQNQEAELSVLGGILLHNEAFDAVADAVEPEDFYREAHAHIFRGMRELRDRAEPIDLVTLSEELRRHGVIERVGGAPYLESLLGAVPTAAHASHYARIVHEKALLRRSIQVASEIAEEGYGDVTSVQAYLDSAEQRIFEIAGDRKRGGAVRVKALLKETFAKLEKLFADKRDYTGIRTGFKDLDDLTSGLQNQNLIIVAARPGMGKTSLCLNIAANAAKAGVPAAVFSLEMSKEEIIQRLLCSEAMVDQSRMRSGHLEKSDWDKLVSGATRLSEAPLFIDDTAALSIMELRAKARRLAADEKIRLLVIDYLQLMRGSSGGNAESREREISEISRSLKALAKELDLPIVALSQLNRGVERREDRKPKLADLRESGAIEQDADLVLFIDREEMYRDETEQKGIAELIIGKHRNGPTGSVHLRFFNQYTLFVNLERDEAPF